MGQLSLRNYTAGYMSKLRTSGYHTSPSDQHAKGGTYSAAIEVECQPGVRVTTGDLNLSLVLNDQRVGCLFALASLAAPKSLGESKESQCVQQSQRWLVLWIENQLVASND